MAKLPETMKSVVLKAPYEVVVEQRPTPKIETDTDVIIKVTQAGLCGSDLHWYRGHQPLPYDFIIGHEVVGTVAAKGSAVKNFEIGDGIVAAFSTCCGDCYYCNLQYTARCVHVQNSGNPNMPGGQAEYFRFPLADTSCFPIPKDIPRDLMIMMTDILPTAYSTSMNARMLANEPVTSHKTAEEVAKGPKKGVCVVIGCGPVGLCAITCALTLFEKVFATDIQTARLAGAERHGAIAMPLEELRPAVLKATENRGADACLEVVGHASALQTAMELCRPYGVISSCGVHTHKAPIDGAMLYGKNLRLQFGRCSIRTFFPFALEVLRNNKELFASFVENKITLDQAPEYYKLFEQNKVAKTVFVMD